MPLRWREAGTETADSWSLRDWIDRWRLRVLLAAVNAMWITLLAPFPVVHWSIGGPLFGRGVEN